MFSIFMRLFLLFFVFTAKAANFEGSATIINHYKDNLYVVLQQYKDIVISPKAREFDLARGEVMRFILQSTVKHEAYISMFAKDNANAYFGFELLGHGVTKMHGYISKKIAYSWTDELSPVVTFCTAFEYQTKGHC